MTTKKDLVEAHAFSRRRLVTAFLSGAPGGREVEPSRPGRTILGGVALAVLVVAGGAVAHELADRPASGWDQQGLVVTDRGSRYIVTRDHAKLRPVVNLTSAQLILGLNPKATVVSQKDVDKKTPGGTIGILGAPEALPQKDKLIRSGWTACTADGKGIAVDLADKPPASDAGGSGVLVSAGHEQWLIAEATASDGSRTAYRYRLPGNASALERLIFNGSVPTVAKVSQDWINLFPAGTPLDGDGFGDLGFGKPSKLKGPGVPSGLTSGTLATFNGRSFVVVPDGWVEISAFAAGVYRSTPHGSQTEPVKLAQLPSMQSTSVQLPQTHWPQGRLAPGPLTPCAELHAAPGETATVTLAAPAAGSEAWPDHAPAAGAVPAVSVTPGMGSFFYVGSGTSTKGDPAYMVDSRGTANLLDDSATIATLGLDQYAAAVVPDTWVKLFGKGTALSTDLALCPPGTTNEKGDRCASAAK